MASPFQAFTKYSFRLNCIFKSFHTILLTENKLACNLGTWNASLIRIWSIFTSQDCLHNDRSHSNGFNNTIIIQMHIVQSDCLIHFECGPIQSHVFDRFQICDPLLHVVGLCLITHYKCVVVIFLYIIHHFVCLVLCFVAKMCNMAWFAVHETRLYALALKMNCRLYFVIIPWQHPLFENTSHCVSISHPSNPPSRSPL